MAKSEYSGDEMMQIICQALETYESKKRITLMNRAAAASRLHVSLTTLWRWNKSGYLRAIKYGSAVWYREEAIEALERGERITTNGEINDD